MLQQAYVTGPV